MERIRATSSSFSAQSASYRPRSRSDSAFSRVTSVKSALQARPSVNASIQRPLSPDSFVAPASQMLTGFFQKNSFEEKAWADAVYKAAQEHNCAALRQLMNGKTPRNVEQHLGLSLIHALKPPITESTAQTVGYLISQGADPDQFFKHNEKLVTPAIYYIILGDTQRLELMIRLGADVQSAFSYILDRLGDSIFQEDLSTYIEMIFFLVEFDVDLESKNSYGKSFFTLIADRLADPKTSKENQDELRWITDNVSFGKSIG